MNTTPVSFFQMFTNEHTDGKININGIEIPIIQRDYAQGRQNKDVARIRKQFIGVLHNALTQNFSSVKLDFVYGNIEAGSLIPLDGQQRLTTLFLLHWYIAKHEKVNDSDYSFLQNFTYKTRFSSRDFCEKLVGDMPDFSLNSISEWIIDQNWFMFSWIDDPTIHSMLVMVDEIHQIFKDTSGLWDKLIQHDNPAISFYFLPLKDMGLTDSLYITMNSRGKPLTEFEHFKAEFEKVIKKESEHLYKEFIQKVDNNWVDMLWHFRGNDNLIDDEFMRYYRFVTEMICYQNEIEIVDNNFDLAEKVYGGNNVQSKENLVFLFKAFDCWTEIDSIDNFFENTFSKNNYESKKVKIYSDNTNIFLQCCNEYGEFVGGGRNRKFSLNSSLLLFGVLQYQLNKNEITEEEFAERIRIIRNLIWNSTDEIREKRMRALLKDTQEIIINREINLTTQGYNQSQKEEEQEKIGWRENNSNLIEDLNHLEDHFLLQGSIRIIGLSETEMFRERARKFRELFNHQIKYLEISNALLTIGDYSQLVSWRFLFGNNNDSTWRELFIVSNSRKNFESTRQILIQLLDSLVGDFKFFIQSKILEFINNPETPKDWRYYFVKYEAMRKGNSGVFYWKNDPTRIKINKYEVLMMNTSYALNGKHWNPFLYTLFTEKDLSEHLSLDEYDAPLILINQRKKVISENNRWVITDLTDDTKVDYIDIKQENGIDIEDRIENMKNSLLEIKGEINSDVTNN